MAFTKIEAKISAGVAGFPVSISLKNTTSSRPTLMIGVSSAFAARLLLSMTHPFDIMIGTDEDAGKLRVRQTLDGVFAPKALKGGSLTIRCGYVPQLGNVPHDKHRVEATVIGAGEFEIALPEWDDDAADAADDADEVVQRGIKGVGAKFVVAAAELAKKAVTIPSPASHAPARIPPVLSESDIVNGVGIDLTEDAESVTFRDVCVEVTTRQAKFVRLLAKPRPQPVGSKFIANALWDGRPPSDADGVINSMARDLTSALKLCGLEVKIVKGVGWQLIEL